MRRRGFDGAYCKLLAHDLYEDAVGQFAFQQVNHAVLHIAFEYLAGGFGGRRGNWAN